MNKPKLSSLLALTALAGVVASTPAAAFNPGVSSRTTSRPASRRAPRMVVSSAKERAAWNANLSSKKLSKTR